MSCPSRVRNPDVANQRIGVEAVSQLLDLADSSAPIDASRPVRNDRKTRRVIAPILEALQSFEQDSWNISARDGAHDAAHTF